MSDSVRPHRWQPTSLPRPWDSPGKNTGVGCHFLLQCVKVKGESEVAQSCLTLSNPMDCRLPGSFVQGIFQARVLEWGAIAFPATRILQYQSRNIGNKKERVAKEEMPLLNMLLLLLSRFSRVRLCATPETAAHQAPPSLGFSGQ